MSFRVEWSVRIVPDPCSTIAAARISDTIVCGSGVAEDDYTKGRAAELASIMAGEATCHALGIERPQMLFSGMTEEETRLMYEIISNRAKTGDIR